MGYPYWNDVNLAIDYLRDEYNVIIYDNGTPHVCPVKNYIVYSCGVKRCNLKHGWNMRENIGKTDWVKDIYVARRRAIAMAIKYLSKNAKVVKI